MPSVVTSRAVSMLARHRTSMGPIGPMRWAAIQDIGTSTCQRPSTWMRCRRSSRLASAQNSLPSAYYDRAIGPRLRKLTGVAVADYAVRELRSLLFAGGHADPGQLPDLVPVLPEAWLPSAGEIAQAIADVWLRARVLRELHSRVATAETDPLLLEVVEAARALGDVEQRAQILEALLPHLPAAMRSAVLPEALAAARA